MKSGIPASHEISTLLRGESETISAWSECWNARRSALHIAVIVLGAGCYGAAMGWWRDPQQALYVAIKFPLIILLTTLGNALINGMLAPLLGLNIPFRQSFSAIVISFTVTAVILGAFSPLIAFMVWNAPAAASTTKPERQTTRVTRQGATVCVRSTTPRRSQKATSMGKRMPTVCTERAGRRRRAPS